MIVELSNAAFWGGLHNIPKQTYMLLEVFTSLYIALKTSSEFKPPQFSGVVFV